MANFKDFLLTLSIHGWDVVVAAGGAAPTYTHPAHQDISDP